MVALYSIDAAHSVGSVLHGDENKHDAWASGIVTSEGFSTAGTVGVQDSFRHCRMCTAPETLVAPAHSLSLLLSPHDALRQWFWSPR